MSRRYEACVSAAHPLAVEAGLSVLRSGGNAVDAAIAVSYMLGVVEPYASGIGGGGVMLVSPPGGRGAVVLDYRETAPMSGIVSPSETGVPGFVKGMEEAHARFGRLALDRLIEPAVRAAEDGFPAGKALELQLVKAQHMERERFPQFYPNGVPLREGETLKQPLLAETMRRLQRSGSSWFYEEEPMRRITARIEGMRADDFRAYAVVVKEPVRSRYDAFDVITVPPPFGGLTFIQALKLSEVLDVHRLPPASARYFDLWGKLMGRCYALRKTTMGDPAYSDIPVERLIDESFIVRLAAETAAGAITAPTPGDVANTTHFVIADADGMCVSTTNTIGGFFTTGVSECGFFLNNQLRNFTDDLASPNRPGPGKRPQSFICPTIFHSERATVAIGSAGGKRIPFTLALVMQHMAKRRLGIEEAVAGARFFIDEGVVHTEAPQGQALCEELESIGYRVAYNDDPWFYGGVHGLMIDHASGEVTGAADPRRGGTWKKAD